MRYISGTKLDERIIRCDLDLGYREGRQFGRGKSGGQVYLLSTSLALVTRSMTRQLRFETSIDRIMILAEVDGVLRPREWKSKEGARSKNATLMWSRVLPWQAAAKSGSTQMHPPQNQRLSALGHPMTRMKVLDNDPGSTKIPGGCSFPSCYFISVFYRDVMQHSSL
jgi:hypothetical protein